MPVLFAESIDLLNIRSGGAYVDLTFGGGGHSRGILERLSAKGRLPGFDQDSDARRNVPRRRPLHVHRIEFPFHAGQLRLHGYEQVDGVLADLERRRTISIRGSADSRSVSTLRSTCG